MPLDVADAVAAGDDGVALVGRRRGLGGQQQGGQQQVRAHGLPLSVNPSLRDVARPRNRRPCRKRRRIGPVAPAARAAILSGPPRSVRVA